MSVLLQSRKTQNGMLPAGFCHCFACGKTTQFSDLLSDIGISASPEPAKAGVIGNEPITLTTTPRESKSALPFRFSPYLAERGIGEETQRRFKIYENKGKVYMPVFNREGKYLYANARSTTSKQFYVESGAIKHLWGVEEIDLSRPIAICESQIDALSFWEVGIQAVATLGADNISCLSEINSSTSVFVLAFDPDAAGLKARKMAAKKLGKYRCYYLDLPEGIDVNQALRDIKDHEVFRNFISTRTKKYVL